MKFKFDEIWTCSSTSNHPNEYFRGTKLEPLYVVLLCKPIMTFQSTFYQVMYKKLSNSKQKVKKSFRNFYLPPPWHWQFFLKYLLELRGLERFDQRDLLLKFFSSEWKCWVSSWLVGYKFGIIYFWKANKKYSECQMRLHNVYNFYVLWAPSNFHIFGEVCVKNKINK